MSTPSGRLLRQSAEHLTQLTVHSLSLTGKPPRHRTSLFLSRVPFPPSCSGEKPCTRVAQFPSLPSPTLVLTLIAGIRNSVKPALQKSFIRIQRSGGTSNGPQRQHAAGTQARPGPKTQEPAKRVLSLAFLLGFFRSAQTPQRCQTLPHPVSHQVL